jgi:hypothetical protein
MPHSCGTYDFDHHFAHRPPGVRALFDALCRAVRRCGRVTMEPQKTRIVFTTRVRFASVTPTAKGLRGHLWLRRARPGAPVVRVESLGPRVFLHHFVLDDPAQIDRAFRSRLKDAYAVGRQEGLRPSG